MPPPACQRTCRPLPPPETTAVRMGETQLEVARRGDQPERAGVDAARVLFQLGDDLHGADLRRTRERSGWKRCDERIEPIPPLRQLAFDA